jgi:hypothetical protein
MMGFTDRPSLLRAATLLTGLALAGAAMIHPTAQAAPAAMAVELEASWEMGEAVNATTMFDSGPNGLHATVNQAGLDTGIWYDGAVGYKWAYRSPTAAPASPERVIQVPDNQNLDPRGDDFTVEIRYRTRERFGNITQKGQATTIGGQFKIENPEGRPSCLFNGSIGRGAVRTPTPINDYRWHVIRCVKTSDAVEMYVDGVRVGRKNGAVGWIDNNWPWVIGGKHKCDQVKVTCDYFTGHIDYVRVYRGR